MPEQRLQRTRTAHTLPRPVEPERELAAWDAELAAEQRRDRLSGVAARITQAQLEADLHAGEP